MVAIYVLRLERGKYYVGLTRKNVERIWQHIDGKGAAWYIDQLGRLGLNPDEEGYSPTQEDLAVFQIELRNVLSKQGL